VAVVGALLGLDVGERRIGVAVSDPDASFALPLRSLDGRQPPEAMNEIASLARDHDAEGVVVGLPLSLGGGDSAQTEIVRAFAHDLEQRLSLPVHLWDERLSTQEAMRRVSDGSPRGRNRKSRAPEADTDAIAASIILQAYLDHQRLAARD
jgi:putative Holliday junction resolvase